MKTATLRKRLHNYLEVADDKKIKAIYTMVEDSIESSGVVYTQEFKAELDRRYQSYKANPSTGISQAESKARIEKILNAATK